MSRTCSPKSVAWSLLLACVALPMVGCIEYLAPGEFGVFRYFGEVRGESPLPLVPPISDRDGNVYILAGSPELPEAEVFVGHLEGSWSGGCTLHKGGDRGAHGWVGSSQDRAWYWSGDALVEVSGATGSCSQILDVDPSSGADLSFLGVLPHVEESPSRATLSALIRSPSDLAPFHVTVDLDLGVYTDVRSSDEQQEGLTGLAVLGVGWDTVSRTGVYVVRFEVDSVVRVEAWFLDQGGEVSATAAIEGADDLSEDSVLGWLQFGVEGPVAGLLEDGRVLVFGRDGGGIEQSSQLTVYGVHRWEDRLWLVGTGNDEPMIAEVTSSGEFLDGVRWSSAEDAQAVLASSVDVLDTTVAPSRTRKWDDPRSAPGEFPFLHPHPPHVYAQGTTLTLIAGPSFELLDTQQTSAAFAPVGISYP